MCRGFRGFIDSEDLALDATEGSDMASTSTSPSPSSSSTTDSSLRTPMPGEVMPGEVTPMPLPMPPASAVSPLMA